MYSNFTRVVSLSSRPWYSALPNTLTLKACPKKNLVFEQPLNFGRFHTETADWLKSRISRSRHRFPYRSHSRSHFVYVVWNMNVRPFFIRTENIGLVFRGFLSWFLPVLQLIIPHVKLHEHSVNQHNNMHRAGMTNWSREWTWWSFTFKLPGLEY